MTKTGATRGVALLLALGLATAACGGGDTGTDSGSSSGAETIRMLEAGGVSGESIEKGYIEPFTEKTGVEVVRDSPYSLGKLQAMVESGNITHQLVELGGADVARARNLGLIEDLDWDLIDPAPIFDEARLDDAFGYQYSSTIMTWRPGAKAPSTWVEFWDTENFPGKRALPDFPTSVLPAAVMASGVAPEDVYPIDIDAAFASLEAIKDDVAVWWSAGAQPPQLLKDGEVDYAIAWSGRVVTEEGIEYTFDEGTLNLSYFVVPKGAENTDPAMLLLHEMSLAENQAKAAEVVPYTGASTELQPLLPEDKLHMFPTSEANKEVQVLTDAEWWYENAEEVQERWEQFKLGL